MMKTTKRRELGKVEAIISYLKSTLQLYLMGKGDFGGSESRKFYFCV